MAQSESLGRFRRAKKAGGPLILRPIYWIRSRCGHVPVLSMEKSPSAHSRTRAAAGTTASRSRLRCRHRTCAPAFPRRTGSTHPSAAGATGFVLSRLELGAARSLDDFCRAPSFSNSALKMGSLRVRAGRQRGRPFIVVVCVCSYTQMLCDRSLKLPSRRNVFSISILYLR